MPMLLHMAQERERAENHKDAASGKEPAAAFSFMHVLRMLLPMNNLAYMINLEDLEIFFFWYEIYEGKEIGCTKVLSCLSSAQNASHYTRLCCQKI